MSRTNIVLDDKLVKEGLKLSGLETKKELVHRALETYIHFEKRRRLLKYQGSGIWKGNLDKTRLRRV